MRSEGLQLFSPGRVLRHSPRVDPTPVNEGTLSVKPFVELFVKGIRVRIARWEQFYPRLSLEVITHQKGIVLRLYSPS